MIKRILIAVLFAPLLALAQTYPSPTFQNLTVLGTTTPGTISGATLTNPTITGGTITGLSSPLAVASGGTGRATASGTSLDNISGFASTGFLTRTGAGAYSFQSLTNGITLGNLAQAAANTVLANTTGSTANVAAFSMPSCSGGSNALGWTSGAGFSCNGTINAGLLLGYTWAIPQAIGITTPNSGAFTTLSSSGGLTVSAGGEHVTGGLTTDTFQLNGASQVPTAATSSNDQTIADTAFVNRDLGCANIMSYGGDNTGSSNNDTAFTNALAAAVNTSSAKCVFFPPGQFNFASRAVFTFSAAYQSVTIRGAGQDTTNLYWSGGQGLEFLYNSGTDSVHLKDFTVSTGSVNTGVGIALVNSFTSTSSAALNTIQNITIRDVNGYFGANYFAYGIYIQGISGVNVDSVQAVGQNGTGGIGMEITTTSASVVPIVFNITNSSFNWFADGFIYGNYVQGVQIANCNFTGDGIGVYVPSGLTGLDQLSITNSQFNVLAGNPNIQINTAVPNLSISNSLFLINNNSSGINMTATSTTTITGNSFEPNTGSPTNVDGIVISGWTNAGGVITGNSFYDLTVGVAFQTGQKNFVLNSNIYQANGTTYSNAGTGNIIGTATP